MPCACREDTLSLGTLVRIKPRLIAGENSGHFQLLCNASRRRPLGTPLARERARRMPAARAPPITARHQQGARLRTGRGRPALGYKSLVATE